MAKKNWIQGAIKKPGAFTAQKNRYNRAKGKNLTTNQFATLVLKEKSKSKFSPTTRRRAGLAKTLRKLGQRD